MMDSLLNQADNIILNSKIDNSDHLRPTFHISPPKGLLNDPNGFIEYDGQYHLFFQWNPFACKHGAKFWAHCVSHDLVHWDFKPTALAPDQEYDRNGCYSGSAFELDGELHLFYTANLKNEQGERFSTQCLAKANDSRCEKYTKIGPVIHQQPAGFTSHFRDPKIWKHQQKWYCVIGAQTEDKLGQVILYKSTDAYNWEFVGPIAGNKIQGLSNFGYMFECPDLFPLANKDILIGCPQGIKPQGIFFQNEHNNGYFVGQFNYEECCYSHGDFRPLDQGFEFYAPQTTEDSQGRRLLSAWVGIPGQDEQPTLTFGWIHALSMIRELRIDKGRVYQQPVVEHKKLRRQKIELAEFELSDNHDFFIETDNCYELNLAVKSIQSTFVIRIMDEGDSWVSLKYDPKYSLIQLDRNNTNYLDGTRECQLIPCDELELQIFVDHSVIEVFVNNGEEVFTSRVFPRDNKSKVTLQSDKSCIISRFVKYDY
ncbi:MAG: beta-fructofuranosidase [Oleiphilaceae bacterium]|jgi:beta-fructofuranosidase